MTGARTFAVVDVETRLSVDAARCLPDGRRGATVERAALQELVAVAVLSFAIGSDGSIAAVDLASRSAGDREEEASLVEWTSDRLDPAYAGGADLVTFNGAHDVSTLRRRCARHWLFDRCVWPEWHVAGEDRHRDMMHAFRFGGQRQPSLVDACAGLGVRAGEPMLATGKAHAGDQACKAEVDVTATALLLFHDLSFEAGSPVPLMRCWTGLAAALLPDHRRRPHLVPLLSNGSVVEAARFLDAHRDHLKT